MDPLFFRRWCNNFFEIFDKNTLTIFDDFNFKCQILRKVGYAFCLNKNLLLYRIRNKSLSQYKIKNIIWVWKINKSFNSLSFFENLSSILSISINSLKKYGLK